MPQRADDVFKALADSHRRKILSALCAEPMVAGELGRLVGLAPNAVSFHLKWLREAGLVETRREGRFLRYHVRRDALADWRSDVRDLFDAATQHAAPHQEPTTRPAASKPADPLTPIQVPRTAGSASTPAAAQPSRPEPAPAATHREPEPDPRKDTDKLPTELL